MKNIIILLSLLFASCTKNYDINEINCVNIHFKNIYSRPKLYINNGYVNLLCVSLNRRDKWVIDSVLYFEDNKPIRIKTFKPFFNTDSICWNEYFGKRNYSFGKFEYDNKFRGIRGQNRFSLISIVLPNSHKILIRIPRHVIDLEASDKFLYIAHYENVNGNFYTVSVISLDEFK